MTDPQQSRSPVQALCFDVFGTLVDWHGGIAGQLEQFFGPRGVQRDWGAVARAWRSFYQPAMEDVRSGRRPFVPLDELHREMFQATAPQFGLGELSPPELHQVTMFWHGLDAWPEVADALVRLRKMHVIAPLSNGNVRLMIDLARHNKLRWDAILGAEIAGMYKPRPEAYLRSVGLLGVPPSACALVAAHNDDLAAARAVGMRTVFVRRPMEYGGTPTPDAEPTQPWDVVVGDLTELCDVLGC